MGKILKNNKIDKETEEMAGEQETSWNRQKLQNPYFSVNNIINGKRGRVIEIEQYKGNSTK